jgi:hypothetical protein
MDDGKPMGEIPKLDYASSHAPLPQSRYGIASVWVSAASLFWRFLPFDIFESSKHDRVGTLASLLGIALAWAGLRQPNRAKSAAYWGLWVGIIALLLYYFFPLI